MKDLLLTFGSYMRLGQYTLEALTDHIVIDNIIEFLDVAIGCIDVLILMGIAERPDKPDAIVEV